MVLLFLQLLLSSCVVGELGQCIQLFIYALSKFGLYLNKPAIYKQLTEMLKGVGMPFVGTHYI